MRTVFGSSLASFLCCSAAVVILVSPSAYAKITSVSNGITLTEVEFDLNSAKLAHSGKKALDNVGAALKDERLSKFNFEISVHTSTDGDDDKNLQLSVDRADAVKKYLVTLGIDASRLKAIGLGESKPIWNPDDTEEKRRINRRVEIKAVSPSVKTQPQSDSSKNESEPERPEEAPKEGATAKPSGTLNTLDSDSADKITEHLLGSEQR
jgi:hypothetical protein